MGEQFQMIRRVRILLLVGVLAGCTSVQVQPLSAEFKPTDICIEENPKVIVSDLLPVLRSRFEFHGITTRVHDQPDPNECEYILTYTAFKNWDMAPYLYSADLRLERNGKKVASAEYRLKGKGGLSLTKWQSTKTKIDPVVDELLGK